MLTLSVCELKKAPASCCIMMERFKPREILPLNGLFWRRDHLDNWGSVFTGMYKRQLIIQSISPFNQINLISLEDFIKF